uniref:Uncharacterized protein n=1 Tax=Tanacetum cinerariifolium TaxID=118510 RepID=A0A6L2JH21_TANCI|nr:hypothetical protein [Tanacetum cinerariifolium]
MPHSFSLEFYLGDLDRSRLILENTLGLGLGLQERLDLCLFSPSLVLIGLDSEYHDVSEHPLMLTIGYSSYHNTLRGLRRMRAHLGLVRNSAVYYYSRLHNGCVTHGDCLAGSRRIVLTKAILLALEDEIINDQRDQTKWVGCVVVVALGRDENKWNGHKTQGLLCWVIKHNGFGCTRRRTRHLALYRKIM